MYQHQPNISRLVTMLAVLFFSVAAPRAAAEMTSGEATALPGTIVWTTPGTVFLADAGERLVLLSKQKLDSAEGRAVSRWEEQNAQLSGLPTRFDQDPQVARKRIVRRDELRGVGNAVIMFALVLNEAGEVENAIVKDTSDERLVDPMSAAMRHWRFTPPVLDGKPTRGVIFVPVQF